MDLWEVDGSACAGWFLIILFFFCLGLLGDDLLFIELVDFCIFLCSSFVSRHVLIN